MMYVGTGLWVVPRIRVDKQKVLIILKRTRVENCQHYGSLLGSPKQYPKRDHHVDNSPHIGAAGRSEL